MRESQWSSEFEQFQRNRLIFGAHRYGMEFGNASYDYVGALRTRLREYEETGNLEFLVDVANYAMLEFVVGRRRGKEMRPVDGGTHCGKKNVR